MSVELRVVGRDHDRRNGHRRTVTATGEELDLLGAVEHEVARVRPGLLARNARLVGLLVDALSGDPEVLEARHEARAVARDLAHQVVFGQVEADVAVEIAVVRVSGIPLVARPDLTARFEVTPKEGDAARAADRRVHAERRGRGCALRRRVSTTVNRMPARASSASKLG